MKREIKFRAWDGKEMLKDWLVISESNGTRVPTTLARKAEIVMQFTGLKDKNGVEIYEGDKVKNKDGMWWIVEFTKGLFYNVNPSNEGELEIIGNIYENPELINKHE